MLHPVTAAECFGTSARSWCPPGGLIVRWTCLALLICVGSGCTHNFLQQNTLSSSSTLSRLQTQQVLDNLALLSCSEAANPCHVNLASGVVQVTDSATGSMLGTLFSSGLANYNNFVPSLSVQRGLVEQWSISPVVDGAQLETLRVAYQKALHPDDAKVDDQIYDQIVSLCVRFTLLPKKETIEHILKPKSGEPHRAACEILRSLESELLKLGEKLDLIERRITVLNKNDKGRISKEALDLKIQRLTERDKFETVGEQWLELASLAGIESHSTPGRGRARKTAYSSRRGQHALQDPESSDMTQLILTALQARQAPGYLPTTDLLWETTRNPALVDQAEDQIGRLEDLLKDFRSPWVFQGCKKDVPACACYVGHANVCKHDCYVWVMPDQEALLRELTQIIMVLGAANPSQDIPARSPAYSPNLR
jgi:hypothetical protein